MTDELLNTDPTLYTKNTTQRDDLRPDFVYKNDEFRNEDTEQVRGAKDDARSFLPWA